MQKYRNKISRKCSLRDYQDQYEGIYQTYPAHQNEPTIVDKKTNKISENFEKTIFLPEISKNSIPTEPEIKYIFQRENTLEEIISYLKKQKANNLPLRFWYRSDSRPREVDNYYIDEKYVQVKYKYKKYYIKFLIDRIRKI